MIKNIAPYDGIVMDLDTDLAIDVPINNTKPLMRVINSGRSQIIAYIPEKERSRLTSGANFKFYPEILALTPIDARIDKIEPVASKRLYEPMMISTYGGSVPAESSPKGHHVPRESVFLVYATPQKSYKSTPRKCVD